MQSVYFAAADVIREATLRERSIKNGVYASNFKNKGHLMRICCGLQKYKKVLDKITQSKEAQKLVKKRSLNPFYLNALFFEYLYGNVRKLSKMEKQLIDPIITFAEHAKDEFLHESNLVENEVCRKIPRYARVNTNKYSIEEALEALRKDGWYCKEIPTIDDESYNKLVDGMSDSDVYLDIHVPNLLIFPHNAKLHNYWMRLEGYLLLQDKASCLSSIALAPTIGSHCFDACAAPGMKTSHLSALVSNTGKIWATDRSRSRVKAMRKVLENAGCTNVKISCGDFIRVDVNDPDFANVKYVLVDAPCSGSGMVDRTDELTEAEENYSGNRLRSLANIQAMLLKHAFKLPNVKKIAYSTCSFFEEENEQVVAENDKVSSGRSVCFQDFWIFSHSTFCPLIFSPRTDSLIKMKQILNDENIAEKFKLVRALKFWSHRGKANYEFGEKCVRSSPEVNRTNGFFIAVFRRKKNSI